MYDYYCKNCNNKIGYFVEYYKEIFSNCCEIQSKNIKSLNFLNCKYCDKFVGILFYPVCKHCFGKPEIFGEKNMVNWFKNFRKISKKYICFSDFNYICILCNRVFYRKQHWFFEELTFHKKQISK